MQAGKEEGASDHCNGGNVHDSAAKHEVLACPASASSRDSAGSYVSRGVAGVVCSCAIDQDQLQAINNDHNQLRNCAINSCKELVLNIVHNCKESQ